MRYIDADALKTAILTKYRANWEIPCSSEDRLIQRVVTDLRVLIEQSITADVAPKSEVDWHREAELNAQRIIELEAEKDALIKNYAECMKNYAREFFEDIYEDCFDQYGYIDYEALAELKKKYTGDSDES